MVFMKGWQKVLIMAVAIFAAIGGLLSYIVLDFFGKQPPLDFNPGETNSTAVYALEDQCIRLCERQKEAGTPMENGPCISENLGSYRGQEWVCDAAHAPKQPVDDMLQNQCQSFIRGTAVRFVEVSTECRMIRIG
jgi:hypothetical protein